MFDATCPSTGSQWKAKVFFRGPLTTLPNDDFSTGTRVRATTSKSNVVELVQKDNMPFPFHGLPALAGCVAKSENLTIPAWLSLLASEKNNNSSTWIPQRPPLQSYILLMTLTTASQGKE